MKRAFTLVELLVVVAVLGILVSIVVVAAKGVMESSRATRASAMRDILRQGLETFYAQEGKWPDVIERKSGDMEGDTYKFTADETDRIFQEVVKRCYGKGGKKSMLMDVSGLFVCEASNCGNSGKGCNDEHRNRRRSDYCGDKNCRMGVDFSQAVAKGSKRAIQIENMAFGYAGPLEGKFCRFTVTYNGKTDSVSVGTATDLKKKKSKVQ